MTDGMVSCSSFYLCSMDVAQQSGLLYETEVIYKIERESQTI